MPSTRAAQRRFNNNFNNRRVAATKEIASVRERRRNPERRFKIKFLLPEGKNVKVNQRGSFVRRMGVI